MDITLLTSTDLNLKEVFDKIVIIEKRIAKVQDKSKFQNEEITKTLDNIEKFKLCYKEQLEALKRFNDDERRLQKEYKELLEIAENKSDTCKNVIKPINSLNNKDFIAKNFKTQEDPYIAQVIVKANKAKSLEKLNNQLCEENNKSVIIDKNDDKVKIINEERDKMVTPSLTQDSLNIDSPRSHFQITVNNSSKKKPKRKIETPPSQMKPKPGKRKKISSKGDSTPKQKLKVKTIDSQELVVNVLVKVDSFPLNKIIDLQGKFVVNKLFVPNKDIYMCGSLGLLTNQQKTSLINYNGHQQKMVKDFYIYNNQVIISMGEDYILANKLSDSSNHRIISQFDAKINCTCEYRGKIYGALCNGSIFVLDMKLEKVKIILRVINEQVICMVAVKVNGIKLLILGTGKNEILAYIINEGMLSPQHLVLKVAGQLMGMLIYSSSVICYTNNSIYLLDKFLWKINVVKTITNQILYLAADMNNLIVLDHCNILHKYIFKKGKIRSGSTVEYLPIKDKVTSMYFNRILKKIYFATGNAVYRQNF